MTLRVRLVILAFFLAVVYAGAWLLFGGRFPDSEEMVLYLRHSGALGPALLIVISIIRGFFFFPPNLTIYVVSGLVFGPYYGAVYALAAGLGCAVVQFGTARYFGYPAVARILDKQSAALPNLEAFTSMPSIILLRLIMVMPFDVANFALGLTPATWFNYVIGTGISLVPGVLIYTMLGNHLLGSQPEVVMLLMAVVTVISLIALVWRYKNWNGRLKDVVNRSINNY